jgi:hypothetical protein
MVSSWTFCIISSLFSSEFNISDPVHTVEAAALHIVGTPRAYSYPARKEE